MSDLRKAAQAVIQAWDDPAGTTGVCRALDDLRAALAEPTVPSDCPDSHQPNPEPVAWRAVGGSIWGHKGSEDDVPLYEHPPQREPLTDREIHDCFQQRSRDKTAERRLITRAIERAHGIGGKYER